MPTYSSTPAYQFRSPAAAFGRSLEESLVQRELERRQALMDRLTQQDTESQIAAREASQANSARQLDLLGRQVAGQEEDPSSSRATRHPPSTYICPALSSLIVRVKHWLVLLKLSIPASQPAKHMTSIHA